MTLCMSLPIKTTANCELFKTLTLYRTADFVCEVLICVNYPSCHRLTNFNSAVTLALSFQLTAHVTVPCL